MRREITLCAIAYTVTDQDGQMIFQSGFSCSTFAFEWKGCGWYLVEMDDRDVYVPHIVAAYEWINTNCVIEWNDGTGIYRLK
jgi:hypothetical protein